jgi:hypothetical protein
MFQISYLLLSRRRPTFTFPDVSRGQPPGLEVSRGEEQSAKQKDGRIRGYQQPSPKPGCFRSLDLAPEVGRLFLLILLILLPHETCMGSKDLVRYEQQSLYTAPPRAGEPRTGDIALLWASAMHVCAAHDVTLGEQLQLKRACTWRR